MRNRLRPEGGFGLVELLLAMLILNIGLLAVVAAFSSGIVTLQRAGKVTTAAVIADQHMELYRALKYDKIALHPGAVSCPPTCPWYSADPAWNASMVTDPGPTCSPPPPECVGWQDVVGPDGDRYRLDTYISYITPTGGRQIKKVTIVVRDTEKLGVTGPAVLARQISTFDQSTG